MNAYSTELQASHEWNRHSCLYELLSPQLPHFLTWGLFGSSIFKRGLPRVAENRRQFGQVIDKLKGI
jgi:hypothetical protein